MIRHLAECLKKDKRVCVSARARVHVCKLYRIASFLLDLSISHQFKAMKQKKRPLVIMYNLNQEDKMVMNLVLRFCPCLQ